MTGLSGTDDDDLLTNLQVRRSRGSEVQEGHKGQVGQEGQELQEGQEDQEDKEGQRVKGSKVQGQDLDLICISKIFEDILWI